MKNAQQHTIKNVHLEAIAKLKKTFSLEPLSIYNFFLKISNLQLFNIKTGYFFEFIFKRSYTLSLLLFVLFHQLH